VDAHAAQSAGSGAGRCDQAAVKADTQAIYRAASWLEAEGQAFARRWRDAYPALVRRLLQDLPELLAFFKRPCSLRRLVRATNVIERCFVEVRRRTRPMVCFVNVQSVERIIFSIFNRFNLVWRQHTFVNLSGFDITDFSRTAAIGTPASRL